MKQFKEIRFDRVQAAPGVDLAKLLLEFAEHKREVLERLSGAGCQYRRVQSNLARVTLRMALNYIV